VQEGRGYVSPPAREQRQVGRAMEVQRCELGAGACMHTHVPEVIGRRGRGEAWLCELGVAADGKGCDAHARAVAGSGMVGRGRVSQEWWWKVCTGATAEGRGSRAWLYVRAAARRSRLCKRGGRWQTRGIEKIGRRAPPGALGMGACAHLRTRQ